MERGKQRILELIIQEKRELHTSYISLKLKMNWARAKIYLDELESAGLISKEIKRGQGGNGNIVYWRLKNA